MEGAAMKRQGRFRGVAGGGRLWGAWTVSCAAGELLGIAAAAAIATVLNRLMAEPAGFAAAVLVLPAMALAGAVEGSSIAWFQWRILRCRLPGLAFGPWLLATVGVAVLGWTLATGATLAAAVGHADESPAQPPLIVIALVASGFGLAGGAVFGAAQWVVLRRQARRAARWIVANGIGWAVAVPCVSVAAALPSQTTAASAIVALGAGAGVLAGLAVGAITGVEVVRLRPAA